MTKEEKAHYVTLPSIGYWTDFAGVEVKRIDYGIEDYLLCVSFASTETPRVHYLKIKTTQGGRPYVIIYGHNMYLDQCLRV